jgi:hypothetical protein
MSAKGHIISLSNHKDGILNPHLTRNTYNSSTHWRWLHSSRGSVFLIIFPWNDLNKSKRLILSKNICRLFVIIAVYSSWGILARQFRQTSVPLNVFEHKVCEWFKYAINNFGKYPCRGNIQSLREHNEHTKRKRLWTQNHKNIIINEE